MTRLAIATAKRIADLGYTAAVIGPNEIQTDAPETICGMAVNAAIMAEGPFTEHDPTIRRRKRRTAKAAAPTTRRRRRRRTTKQLRRKVRAQTTKLRTLRKRRMKRHGPRSTKGWAPFGRAYLAREKTAGQLARRKTRKTTKRRRKGRKLAGAAKAAFLARMASGRK